MNKATGPRLLFRVDPLPLESPRGYLSRVAQEHGYHGPLAIAQIAGLQRTSLERNEDAEQIAYALRLEPGEWQAMRYRPVSGEGRYRQRSFCGERITGDDLNYERTRVCPDCLKYRPIWWAVWDLGLVTACPRHRCNLIDRCPACARWLHWRRPAVHRCRCGMDLRSAAADPAPNDLLAINAAIFRAAGASPGPYAEEALRAAGFSPGLLRLKLGRLLRLILFAGSIREGDRLRPKQQPFAATNLVAARAIDRAAVSLLRDWPRPFHEVLRRMLPPVGDDPSALNFSQVFGNFYRHLFRVLAPSEFGFLREEFERFVVADWKGLIRGNHRYFSETVRAQSLWVCSNEAEKMARTTANRIMELVRTRDIDGVFLNASSRTECWVRRESLNQWIAKRDAELARYMVRPEVERTLGLKNITVTAVAAAGAIRYVRGPNKDFPSGYDYFLREDVLKIQQAFERHAVPTQNYEKPGICIALRHAMKNFLGRLGLAAVIRAMADGKLAPVGYASQFCGITGYLFLLEDLRRYRPVSGIAPSRQGFLNFRETAALLSVRTIVVRGLVAEGLLSVVPGHSNGYSKLIPAADVRSFADKYVSASALAKRLHISVEAVTLQARASNATVLAVRIPETGRGHALFVPAEMEAWLSTSPPGEQQ